MVAVFTLFLPGLLFFFICFHVTYKELMHFSAIHPVQIDILSDATEGFFVVVVALTTMLRLIKSHCN